MDKRKAKFVGSLFLNKSRKTGKPYLTGTINGVKVYGHYREKEVTGKDGVVFNAKMFSIEETAEELVEVKKDVDIEF